MMRRIVIAACLASASMALPATAASASADSCPNEQLRLESGSNSLPDCRAYELVSPAEKSGQIVGFPGLLYQPSEEALNAVSPNGEKVIWETLAPYPGANGGLPQDVEATRGPSGWSSHSFAPVPVYHPSLLSRTVLTNVTTDFSLGFASTIDPLDPLDQDQSFLLPFNDVYTIEPDGSAIWDSRPNGTTGPDTTQAQARYIGSSSAGSHVLFLTTESLASTDAGRVAGRQLYDRTGGETIVVGLRSDGSLQSACGATLGSATEVGESGVNGTFHAVSNDGSHIFFTSPDPSASFVGFGEPGDPSCAEPPQLYLRLNGTTTVEVSASQRSVPDPGGPRGATFEGASSDGSRVFFSSPEMLTNGATEGGGLYEYDVLDATLTFIAPDGSELVQTEDGSRIYFSSPVRMAGAPETALAGYIYLYEGEHVRYVSESTLPFALEGMDRRPYRISADGSQLAFVDTGRLTSYDNHEVAELYTWNVSADRVSCVSCNPTGAPPIGPARLVDDVTASLQPTYPLSRVFSSDGTELFFMTQDSLVPADDNGEFDVYEWKQANTGACSAASASFSIGAGGCIYLISGGRGLQGSYLLGLGGGGEDVLFTTTDSLVSNDIDNGGNDMYDARVDGGFPALPAPPAPCGTEACQGAAAAPPSLPAPASAAGAGGGNLAPVSPARVVPVKKPTRAQELAKALKACKAKRGKKLRTSCEAAARKKYGPAQRAKSKKKSAKRGK